MMMIICIGCMIEYESRLNDNLSYCIKITTLFLILLTMISNFCSILGTLQISIGTSIESQEAGESSGYVD